MSLELIQKLRERVNTLIAPHVHVYGDDAPTVKMALMVLAEAESIERELGEERISTERAVDLTGWSRETLQKYARMAIDGAELPAAWGGLRAEETTSGYLFQLGTIPANPRAELRSA